jgi:hypothetical protein
MGNGKKVYVHIATFLDGMIFKWQNIIQPIEILQTHDTSYCREKSQGGVKIIQTSSDI